MASVLGNLLFGLVMMVVGGMIALLMIVWEMITHPFTVFKKIPRNGELAYQIVWVPAPSQEGGRVWYTSHQ